MENITKKELLEWLTKDNSESYLVVSAVQGGFSMVPKEIMGVNVWADGEKDLARSIIVRNVNQN